MGEYFMNIIDTGGGIHDLFLIEKNQRAQQYYCQISFCGDDLYP